MGTRLYYRRSGGQLTDPIIEKLAARFGSHLRSIQLFQFSANLYLLNLPERSLVITDEPLNSTYIESPPESSDREVSPKLVVGTKKYGRRSRPQQGIYELSVTDSDNTDEDQLQQQQNQRSLNGCDELGVQVSVVCQVTYEVAIQLLVMYAKLHSKQILFNRYYC